MTENEQQSFTWTMVAKGEEETNRLARHFASFVGPGDLITLSGGLGVGKTTFARGLIRAVSRDPAIEVPSPTFTLMQVYESERCALIHADLFRLQSRDELEALGWEEMSENALVLVEWPERAGVDTATERLDVTFALPPAAAAKASEERIVTFTGTGAWQARLRLARAAFDLLASRGWNEAKREFIQGDASTRAYERLWRPGESAILMISPPRPDGPPLRDGRPYSAIAKLAERADAFVAMAQGLAELGYSTPKVLARDLDEGLLILEDLGDEGVVEAGGPIAERYALAAELLADLHRRDLPETLPIEPGREHSIPRYDLEALLVEVDLLNDWFAPHVLRSPVPASARAEFARHWRSALVPIVTGARSWTLRDFHSPNLLWLSGREGLAKLGLLDIQDAVIGHPAYDLASLLQDARVDVPPELELKLLAAYTHARKAADGKFDLATFAAAYATLGAQRATKILGIFARLDRRDGKPQYLAHIPRLKKYLMRNLTHPALRDLKLWYETNLPGVFGAVQ
ncbi:MAG: tRNA (adenosine(37)-N6)-threonylcarbamoyltransferase complex ATPase subunit type 1 TsaE [Hyphomicrobiales bacterium]|nr:tRNA (adenosine(37)-N6)-threonylcarbamoyltransferase complex ATPase subunit type 1 TsaE [Hyphomicrobiales bacterium]MBV9520189.1 tRNA (adenosine(37)-N6)-threonylcarbamoyltransferase complex ATPase subunit type 1 TsaE [Hyphomicrobiales bacterium]